MVVEVMGRHTGWIAVHSGIAGGADVILIPEQPMTVEDACARLEKRHKTGKDFSIVVVSEGYELTYASGEKRSSPARRDPPISSAMSFSAALAESSPARSSIEPVTRRVSPCSATSSAVAHPPHATGCWQRGTG